MRYKFQAAPGRARYGWRLVIFGLSLVAPAVSQTAETAPASAPASEPATSQPDEKPPGPGSFANLRFRLLGPALSSGRIGDLAVNPNNRSEYYVAVASGGVWKTTNAGTTFTPIFDAQGSYSIGCLALDPRNPHTIWVGTGENNAQRSVSWGDGVYRSRDGGQSWENLGLRDSEHIGMIAIDPRNSDVVYVAAQGPLWRSGSDRGLYKTINGGVTWMRVLDISEDTGVNEVHLDPRDPDTVYASAWQRRRHVWTLIDGGPESAIYKSTDAGVTWRKVNAGLPDGDLGRIGLDISPVNPDVLYAVVEAADGKSGFFRSANRGESWEKRSSYNATSPMYYNEIVCDPFDVDRVFALDTFLQETTDGGKTFRRVPQRSIHVDYHALWRDPKDPQYILVGNDGGVYETFDGGSNWAYKPNLPVTQFYRVTVDNSTPFYFVYGGTQDNNTLGAPSQTTDAVGIANDHWFFTVGGDGFETQIDPKDPNIVYSQYQYGGLVRHDRRSGETLDIKPREAPGEEPLRWNWDSPLIISPHNHKRLYYAANRVYRSDDQGDSWTAVSPDLTRQIDPSTLPVFGRIQSVDAVAKGASTSFYGNIVSLAESPLVEGLIYAGTDDGLVQVTEDGGKTWRKIERFPGVPEQTYVSCLTVSQHERGRVYAAFDNHKKGDFRPYILVSDDKGETWKAIAGGISERDTVYSIAEDHVTPRLLFAGTEFGAWYSVDGGEKWNKFKGGLPTIAVRDIDIQRRENDLVLGTFGRGIYILDDYSPIRAAAEDVMKQDAAIFPIKDALHYAKANRLGGRDGRGWMGAQYFSAPNPPFGATVTYHLKEKLQTRKERRQEAEKKAAKSGSTTQPAYPTWEELREEDREKPPQVLLVIRDESGAVLRRVTASRDKGVQRVTWDLRLASAMPTRLAPTGELDPWDREPEGPLAPPGKYTAELVKEVDGAVSILAGPTPFNVIPLELATFAAKDKQAALAFHQKVARLQRATQGASRVADEVQNRLALVRKAILDTPGADPALLAEQTRIQTALDDLLLSLRGDPTRAKRNAPEPLSILERVGAITGAQWYVTSAPTGTQKLEYERAGGEFGPVLAGLRKIYDADLPALEAKLEKAGAAWTPGRLPDWSME